eukprot:scaffold76540_cov69-Phaeocystis_antarctica.AAC.1
MQGAPQPALGIAYLFGLLRAAWAARWPLRGKVDWSSFADLREHEPGSLGDGQAEAVAPRSPFWQPRSVGHIRTEAEEVSIPGATLPLVPLHQQEAAVQATVLPSRCCNLDMDRTQDAEPPFDVESGGGLSHLRWPTLALKLWVGHILWRQ